MRLKVFRVEKSCFFELAWGQSQQMTAQVAYPETLTQLYEHWQTCYLDFYRTDLRSEDAMRGRIKNSGTLSAAAIDYRSRLVSAEAEFLAEFYDWLKSRELLDIRSKIAQLSKQTDNSGSLGTPRFQTFNANLFLTCEPLALARFPWEVWEILGEFGQRSNLRIIRTPANLRHQPALRKRTGKMRMLVILGDETGLSFQAEITALKALERFAEVQFEGWHVRESIVGLKERIAQKLVDPEGWDILFFAGHSNESLLTGGELAIAPQTSIFLKEIQPQLLKAKENGLQFAIFNSCKGLDLANTLIDLGLSQVAIMREPIHNDVAQDFLIQFIQSLIPNGTTREPQNVYDALAQACQYLKLDRNLTYPSTYFIPSFFCRPETQPFFIPRILGIQHQIRLLLPSYRQALALAAIALSTVITPLQDLLLDGRLVTQSLYRQITNQVPKNTPKIRIVQIDNASIQSGLIGARMTNPIDRLAIAKIVDSIGLTSPKVLAIDYVFDRPLPEDPILRASLSKAHTRNIALVLGSDSQGLATSGISPTLLTPDNPNHIKNGQIAFYPNYLSQPNTRDCKEQCPFSYAAAEAYLDSTTALAPMPPWRSILYRFGIMAFHPLVDYSIPNDQIYTTSSAIQALNVSTADPRPEEPIVLLAAGDYGDAGINSRGEDKFPLPSAIAYWNRITGKPVPSQITGAEIQAYMIYHALNQRSVIPIPDLLMVGLAAILGAGFQARRRLRNDRYGTWNIFVAYVMYGTIGLQAFITVGLLLPWLLPSLTLGLYHLPFFNTTNHRNRSS